VGQAMAADRVIRWTTAGAVSGVAGVAAVASYERAYDLVRAHGEAGLDRPGTWRGGLDGPSSPADGGRADLSEFDGDARFGASQGGGARAGAVAARPRNRDDADSQRGSRTRTRPDRWRCSRAWSAVALVGSYEVLMVIVSSARVPGGRSLPGAADRMPSADPLQVRGDIRGRAGGRAGALGARDPRTAACGAAACAAGAHTSGRVQRHSAGGVFRLSGCHHRSLAGSLMRPPHTHRRISAFLRR
jgi:hypothetical protein